MLVALGELLGEAPKLRVADEVTVGVTVSDILPVPVPDGELVAVTLDVGLVLAV